MYYEEKIINGVLMWRNSPTGQWTQCSISSMSQRIVGMAEEITRLRAKLAEVEGQEAVAEVIDSAPLGISMAWIKLPSEGPRPPIGTKLYTHPAPAKVPDILDDMDRVPPSVLHGDGWSPASSYAYGWNACREAMLKSQGGD